MADYFTPFDNQAMSRALQPFVETDRYNQKMQLEMAQQQRQAQLADLQIKKYLADAEKEKMVRQQTNALAGMIPSLQEKNSVYSQGIGPYTDTIPMPLDNPRLNAGGLVQDLALAQAQYPMADHDKINEFRKALEAQQAKYHYMANAQGQPMRILDTAGAKPELLDAAIKDVVAKADPSGYFSYINNGSFKDTGSLDSDYARNAREALSSYGMDPKDVMLQSVKAKGAAGKDTVGQYNLAGDFKKDDAGQTIITNPAPKAPRQMPLAIQNDLGTLGKDMDSAEYLVSAFRPEYAGWKSTNLATVGIEAAKRFQSGKATEDQSLFWMAYQNQINAYRNGLFGAALTPTEKAEFEKSIINPAMKPDLIAAYLKRQDALLKKSAARKASTNVRSYGQEDVESLLGRPISSLPSAMGSGYAPPPSAPAKPSPKVTPSGKPRFQILKVEK